MILDYFQTYLRDYKANLPHEVRVDPLKLIDG
jgi:hypothetical protein